MPKAKETYTPAISNGHKFWVLAVSWKTISWEASGKDILLMSSDFGVLEEGLPAGDITSHDRLRWFPHWLMLRETEQEMG